MMTTEDHSENVFVSLGCLIQIIYFILIVFGGGIWIDENFGLFVGFIAFIAAFPFRFPIPLMIGAAFYLMDYHDWNGFFAFIVVFLPGLPIMLMTPLIAAWRAFFERKT